MIIPRLLLFDNDGYLFTGVLPFLGPAGVVVAAVVVSILVGIAVSRGGQGTPRATFFHTFFLLH
ncbi:MAG: hypothetical protein UY45_C0001G0131 [Parcubacteria group bacterium GW2011_GWA1_49_26]|nr:MAG: hypothetical protein UY45_C0001G0131 [Parcubacteria group bacterium GW2011_GWA1_49_26]